MTKPKKPHGLPDMELLKQATGNSEEVGETRLEFGGFGAPPVFGNPEVTHDDERLQQDYTNFDNPEDEEEDEEFDEDDEDFDDDEYDDDEYEEPPSLRQPGGGFLRDQPIFPGGPMTTEVNSWKKQFEVDGHSLHLSEDIGGINFIWRTLARTEYRDLMNIPNTDPLQREEMICEICVLFPYDYNFSSMGSQKAGIPAMLSEQILEQSGFQRPITPIRL